MPLYTKSCYISGVLCALSLVLCYALAVSPISTVDGMFLYICVVTLMHLFSFFALTIHDAYYGVKSTDSVNNCCISFSLIMSLSCGICAYSYYKGYVALAGKVHYYNVSPYNVSSISISNADVIHFKSEAFAKPDLGACKQVIREHGSVTYCCVSPIVMGEDGHEEKEITYWAAQQSHSKGDFPICESHCVGKITKRMYHHFEGATENAKYHHAISGENAAIFVELVPDFFGTMEFEKQAGKKFFILPVIFYAFFFVIELLVYIFQQLYKQIPDKAKKKTKKQWVNILHVIEEV